MLRPFLQNLTTLMTTNYEARQALFNSLPTQDGDRVLAVTSFDFNPAEYNRHTLDLRHSQNECDGA